MRILIFSGYNHILQSAAALATACHAARRGARVLLVSVGPGHLAGALLGQSLGPRPLELEPHLAAMEVGPVDEIGGRWDDVRPTLRGTFANRIREIGSDELPAFPGMDAVAALLVAEKARQTGRFDLMILDGPTPDSLLRAVALPDVMRWLLRLVFGIDRGPGRSRLSQDTAIIPTSLIAPNAVAPLQDLRIVLEEQRARLDGLAGTRFRLVVTPEELHLPAVRLMLGNLGLYGLASDELTVIGELSEVDEHSRRDFSPETGPVRPHLRVGPLPTRPTDRDTWALRGAALYRDSEIFSPHAPTRPAVGEREIRLYIPFMDPKELDLALVNEEVVVRLGQQRRHVLLPGIAEGGRLRARVEGEVLRLWVE
ncbi:MAG: ATPase [Chloroflexi bacterium]|nr:ATPase [Chloroflexota bacterium]